MDFLQKLRSLPEFQRKTILWVVVIIIGLGLFAWWLKSAKKALQNFSGQEVMEQFQTPSLDIELPSLPSTEEPIQNGQQQ